MSVAVIYPDSTPTPGGTVTGLGGDHDAVLADSDDATYITFAPGEGAAFGLTNPSFPSGAVITRLSLLARGYKTTLAASRLDATLLTGGIVRTFNNATVTWGSVGQWEQIALADTGLDYNSAQVAVSVPSGFVGPMRLTTLALVVYYVAKPTTNVVYPTGTLADDNLPTIWWQSTLDSEGGPQTAARVKVFSAAQYGAGGFNPSTSAATFSTGFYGPAAVTRVADRLPDGDYRAYVQVAQTVKGSPLWSDWNYEAFTIAVDKPGLPGLAVFTESDRVRIELNDSAGAATTTGFTLERLDGDEWVGVRTLEDDKGTVTATDAIIYDYEGTSGQTSRYRARAAHTFGSGNQAVTDWVEAQTVETIDYGRWAVRHPTMPWLNELFDLRSFQSQTREARQTISQPLGAVTAVVISDTPGAESGSITFRVGDDSTRDAIKALLSSPSPLYLMPPAGHHEPSRWVVFGSEEISRLVDNAWINERDATYTWTVVGRPSEPVVGWPGLYPGDSVFPADDLFPG